MPLGSVTLVGFSGTVVFRLMNSQARYTGTRRKPALAFCIKTRMQKTNGSRIYVSALNIVYARTLATSNGKVLITDPLWGQLMHKTMFSVQGHSSCISEPWGEA